MATVDRDTLVLEFDELLDASSVPAPGAFSVRLDGTQTTVSAVAVRRSTVRLTLGTPASPGQTVTVSYTVPEDNPIRDGHRLDEDHHNEAAGFAGVTVGNNTVESATDTDPPQAVGAIVVIPGWLTVTYDERLDEASVPSAGAFEVGLVSAGDDRDGAGWTAERCRARR